MARRATSFPSVTTELTNRISMKVEVCEYDPALAAQLVERELDEADWACCSVGPNEWKTAIWNRLRTEPKLMEEFVKLCITEYATLHMFRSIGPGGLSALERFLSALGEHSAPVRLATVEDLISCVSITPSHIALSHRKNDVMLQERSIDVNDTLTWTGEDLEREYVERLPRVAHWSATIDATAPFTMKAKTATAAFLLQHHCVLRHLAVQQETVSLIESALFTLDQDVDFVASSYAEWRRSDSEMVAALLPKILHAPVNMRMKIVPMLTKGLLDDIHHERGPWTLAVSISPAVSESGPQPKQA